MKGNTNKVLSAGMGVILVFILAFAITEVGFMSHSDIASVDTQTEWEEGTLTDLVATDGTLQLNGTNSGDYVSEDFDYEENISQIRVWADSDDEDAEATVTVTSYDDTDSELDSKSETINDFKNIDLADLAENGDGHYYTVEVELERESSDDEVTVDKYSVEDESESFLVDVTAILLVLGGLGYALRRKL